MKVVVYEPDASGHRMHYVSKILPAINDLGIRPILATSESAKTSADFEGHLGSVQSLFDAYTTTDKTGEPGDSSLKLISDRLSSFKSMLNEIQPDHILVPTAGCLARAMTYQFLTFGKLPIKHDACLEGLYFGQGYGYETTTKKRMWLKVRKWLDQRQPWTTYFHIDPFQLENVRRRCSKTAYRLMPDPVPAKQVSKAVARRHFGIPEDGRYIGIAGGISVAKGTLDLLSAFDKIHADLPTTDRVLLAGPFDEEVRNRLKSDFAHLVQSKRVVCIDKRLYGEDIDLAFPAMDIFCAAHRGQPGSSSTLIRAAAAQVPVIARNRFWTSRIVPLVHLGWTADTWDKGRFASQLKDCLGQVDQYQPTVATNRFVKFHSVENFQATWTSSLRKRMGLPQDDRKVDWSWVLEGSN